jgi:3-dehydroquinate synthetase
MIHAFLAQHFKFHITRAVQATDLIERSRRDKKVADGRLNLILLERPGSLKIVPVEYDASLEAAVTEYLYKSSIITSR